MAMMAILFLCEIKCDRITLFCYRPDKAASCQIVKGVKVLGIIDLAHHFAQKITVLWIG
jgi:hypothetical protein